ncbi:DUF3895 domain-containing protein [Metabacillus fastidiosus]|uniref:DUF3895 domain-containing protein n=1 Tax=Metabacillus fastidiosus TaxID=1458 RepID=UPI002E1EB29D|nr:DUF3895 domain-containing protein [Metabacillus fastidiosus]
MVKQILEKNTRDQLLNSLQKEQKEFLQFQVKRGKKTVFANALARDKGIVLPENTELEDLETLLDEWILEDYIDSGFVNPQTPCECGRSLRYQYIVKHQTTNEIRRFGKTHFEEHTGIPASIVKEILKGFDAIDYEMDELLFKIKQSWTIEEEFSYIPDDLTLPSDIQDHLDHAVPLLDRQIKRLRKLISTYIENKEYEALEYDLIESDEELEEIEFESNEDQVSFDFFNYEVKDKQKAVSLNQIHKDAINDFLASGVTSARMICELLIKHSNISDGRYTTTKPKIYYDVCIYLDSLIDDSESITNIGTEDRIYKLNIKQTI